MDIICYGDKMIIVSKSDRLNGSVKICGSKNAVLPIMAACLAVDGKTVLKNVPDLADVHNMIKILNSLGCDVNIEDGTFIINNTVKEFITPFELVNKLRASFILCGPMLAKYKKIRISLPGGCQIGTRPVDLHLKGFLKLGAEIEEGQGFIQLTCEKLHGSKICLDFPSVGATENLFIAATLAKGTTEIINAATEPEVVDLTNFLINCGADIKGIGTKELIINGVNELHGCTHEIIPDRIEAGTYMLAAAITGGSIEIEGVKSDALSPVTSKLREMGVDIIENESKIKLISTDELKCVNIKTMPHPGFPTDMQSQFCSVMCNATGTSVVTETVFENRFMHIGELLRMHADITIDGRNAVINGSRTLTGCEVNATDLRAGAALVIAGLAANGTTKISNSHYIDRGYENLVGKLQQLGANIYYKKMV